RSCCGSWRANALTCESAAARGAQHHGPPGARAIEQARGPRGRQTMDPQALIIWLVIGAVAGWLAGQIVKGGGFGVVGDIVVGMIGAVVAGWLLPRVGLYIGGGFIAEIINAVIGAVILLVVVRLVKR